MSQHFHFRGRCIQKLLEEAKTTFPKFLNNMNKLKKNIPCQDVEENSEEFEVSLYPLNLGSTYNILDQQYRTFATVNLHLGTELTD